MMFAFKSAAVRNGAPFRPGQSQIGLSCLESRRFPARVHARLSFFLCCNRSHPVSHFHIRKVAVSGRRDRRRSPAPHQCRRTVEPSCSTCPPGRGRRTASSPRPSTACWKTLARPVRRGVKASLITAANYDEHLPRTSSGVRPHHRGNPPSAWTGRIAVREGGTVHPA